MKRIIPLLLLALTACACSRSQSDPTPTLAVSIGPQKYLLEQIVGDGFRIITIMDENASPETFEPSMARRMEADRAEAYFAVGLIPFEESLTASLQAGGTPVINTSEGIELMYGTHEHHHDADNHDANCGDHDANQSHQRHHHGAPDPHVWGSLQNARIMACNMLNALCELHPDSCQTYTARFERLDSILAATDSAIEAKLHDAPQRTFAIWHPSLSYFARDYSLEQMPIDPETKEISMQQRRHIIDQARDHGITTLFVQRQYDTRQAASINKAIGARMVEINPMNPNIIEELENVADQLAR